MATANKSTWTHIGERSEFSARLSPTSSLLGPSQSPLSTTFNTATLATQKSSGPSKKQYGLSETISRLHGSRVLEESQFLQRRHSDKNCHQTFARNCGLRTSECQS